MKRIPSMSARSGSLGLLLVAIVISGACSAATLSPVAADWEDQSVPSQPAASIDAPPLEPVAFTRNSSNAKASSSVKLELKYAERILVPRGSELRVRVKDAKGQAVFAQKSATKHDAPPYQVEVPIRKTVAYPLTIEVSLVSRTGHRFSESLEFSQTDVEKPAPLQITMHMQ
jgi:hypothetical protein